MYIKPSILRKESCALVSNLKIQMCEARELVARKHGFRSWEYLMNSQLKFTPSCLEELIKIFDPEESTLITGPNLNCVFDFVYRLALELSANDYSLAIDSCEADKEIGLRLLNISSGIDFKKLKTIDFSDDELLKLSEAITKLVAAKIFFYHSNEKSHSEISSQLKVVQSNFYKNMIFKEIGEIKEKELVPFLLSEKEVSFYKTVIHFSKYENAQHYERFDKIINVISAKDGAGYLVSMSSPVCFEFEVNF